MAFEALLSPGKIGSMTLKNRVVMTAAEMSMGDTDGRATGKLISYYEERAKGGVGLIITGTTRVNDWDSASMFTQLAMSHDYHIEPIREMVRRIHSHGAKLCVQLHHAGRQGYAISNNTLPMVIPMVKTIPQTKKLLFKMTPALYKLEQKGLIPPVTAPSKCEPSYHVDTRMRAMSRKKVKSLIQDFIAAARRCQAAGVDAVELHGAHGYLIEQFLSPNTNHRTDEYGGSLKNRMRFLLEIIAGIRAACGKDYPILVRLTVDEMYARIGKEGKGYTLEEGKKMAKLLEEAGIDALDVTSGCYDTYNYWLEPTTFEPGWRAYLAKEIKSVVSIPVIAANFMRSPQQAEQQLKDGVQDFIGSARSFICDPYWVKKVEEGRTDEIRRCIGCLGCIESLTENAFRGTNAICALNPYVGREAEQILKKDGNGRLVVVVGAGVSGLTAAETLAKRGFQVKVLEKEAVPGGQINIASRCNGRDKLRWSMEGLLASVSKLGVEVSFNTEATVESIKAMQPYAVILSTGAVPIRPGSIKGSYLPHVCTAPEVILGEKKIAGKKVAVIGSGMTGLETAELLGEAGNQVTVVEMANQIAPGAWFQMVDDELARLKGFNTRFLPGKRLMAIREKEILLEDEGTRQLETLPVDEVVLSLGARPFAPLYQELRSQGVKVYITGDAKASGRIGHAVHDAFETANKIH